MCTVDGGALYCVFLDLTLALTSVHSAVFLKKKRWLDVDKDVSVYQSRLVAKDFRPKNKIDDCEGLYESTLPLEVLNFLIMQAATKCRQGEVQKVMLIDISKAHRGRAVRRFGAGAGEGWEVLPVAGSGSTLRPWRRMDLCPALPRSALSSTPARTIRTVVHGDDFVIEGGQEDLTTKVADILNRVVGWRDDELWWEADPRSCGLQAGGVTGWIFSLSLPHVLFSCERLS